MVIEYALDLHSVCSTVLFCVDYQHLSCNCLAGIAYALLVENCAVVKIINWTADEPSERFLSMTFVVLGSVRWLKPNKINWHIQATSKLVALVVFMLASAVSTWSSQGALLEGLIFSVERTSSK